MRFVEARPRIHSAREVVAFKVGFVEVESRNLPGKFRKMQVLQGMLYL